MSTKNVSLRISRVQIISLVAFPTAAVGPSRSWTPRPAAVVHFVVPILCFHMFPYASIFLGFCARSCRISVFFVFLLLLPYPARIIEFRYVNDETISLLDPAATPHHVFPAFKARRVQKISLQTSCCMERR